LNIIHCFPLQYCASLLSPLCPLLLPISKTTPNPKVIARYKALSKPETLLPSLKLAAPRCHPLLISGSFAVAGIRVQGFGTSTLHSLLTMLVGFIFLSLFLFFLLFWDLVLYSYPLFLLYIMMGSSPDGLRKTKGQAQMATNCEVLEW